MRKRRIGTIIPPSLKKIRNSPFCYRNLLPGEEGAGKGDAELVESIRSSGIITPALLTPFETIVLGHRRLAAAAAAGLKEIEVMILDADHDGELAGAGMDSSSLDKSKGTESLAAFVPIWLEDALPGSELSELEKIILLKKALDFFSEDLSPVLPPLSKIFGRRLSAEISSKMTALLVQAPEVLDAIHQGYVKPADLLHLSSRKVIDVTQAVQFLSENSLSRAKQKESVRLIAYLADQGEGRWEMFAKEYDKSGGSLPDLLRIACYPALTRDTQAIDEIITGIRLPQHAKILPPGNLEGGAYLLNIRIRDEEKLRTALEKVESALAEGKIATLLEILKG